jgi:tRNA(fMet)-specific endonuclease VapC
MPVRYLLDTNTASYIIKGNRSRVRERLLRVAMADVGISVITEAELLFGLARRPEATKLKTVVEEPSRQASFSLRAMPFFVE